MTKEEYDQLPSDGRVACPVCGLKKTTPCPGCHCPSGLFTRHINMYHHNCKQALEETYPTNKKNIGYGSKIEYAETDEYHAPTLELIIMVSALLISLFFFLGGD